MEYTKEEVEYVVARARLITEAYQKRKEMITDGESGFRWGYLEGLLQAENEALEALSSENRTLSEVKE